MRDFSCAHASHMYYGVLANKVSFFRENKEDILIMYKDMKKESLKERIKEGTISTGKKMLTDGITTLKKIGEFVGLLIDEVKNEKQTRQYRQECNHESEIGNISSRLYFFVLKESDRFIINIIIKYTIIKKSGISYSH